MPLDKVLVHNHLIGGGFGRRLEADGVMRAVDCGTVFNPDTVRAQIRSAIMFGITASLYGEITLKDGRVEQTNFDTYQMLRMNEVPASSVGAWRGCVQRRSLWPNVRSPRPPVWPPWSRSPT
jgi:hypothetical protein